MTTSTPTERLARWLAPSWIEGESGFPDRSMQGDDAAASGAALATGGGVVLTEALVARSIAFAEFLAGHHVEESQRSTIVAATLDEFDGDPHAVTRNLVGVAQAVERIPGLSPIVRARLRHQALNRIAGLEWRTGAEPSPTMACVYRYNPVIAVSDDGQTVVTDDAVLAWRWLRELVLDVAGHETAWSEAAYRVELDEGFAGWPSERQRTLAEAHPAVVAVAVGLRRLDVDDLDQLAATIADQATGPTGVEQAALALGSIGRIHDLIGAVRRATLSETGR